MMKIVHLSSTGKYIRLQKFNEYSNIYAAAIMRLLLMVLKCTMLLEDESPWLAKKLPSYSAWFTRSRVILQNHSQAMNNWVLKPCHIWFKSLWRCLGYQSLITDSVRDLSFYKPANDKLRYLHFIITDVLSCGFNDTMWRWAYLFDYQIKLPLFLLV